MASTNPIGPFDVLIPLDLKMLSKGRLDPDERERYDEVIEVLRQISDADQGDITRGLVNLALGNFPGAARALRGLRLPPERRKIVSLIELYLDDPEPASRLTGDKPKAANNLPLVLSGTIDPSEIRLLIKCSQFKRPDGSRTAEDVVFCTNAIEALKTTQSPLAQEPLLMALASENETISIAALWALSWYCTEDTRARLRELLALPKRDAINRLARMQGKGRFAAFKDSLFDSSIYDRFVGHARALTSRLRPEQ